MNPFARLSVLSFCVALAACGGGASGGSNSPAGPTYPFVAPAVGSQRNYLQTIVDNANNSIGLTLLDTVSAVNGDGSYVYTQSDPKSETFVVNGTTYAIIPETITADSSGRIDQYLFTVGSSAVSCTNTPYGAGPPYPATVGEAWSTAFTQSCSSGSALTYAQAGTVVDAETVTVPAGTFTALKLQSSLTWTDAAGTTRTQSITRWRDVNNGLGVKEVTVTAYSGTQPVNGYPVTVTTELQSQ